jgi:hypothetical protein
VSWRVCSVRRQPVESESHASDVYEDGEAAAVSIIGSAQPRHQQLLRLLYTNRLDKVFHSFLARHARRLSGHCSLCVVHAADQPFNLQLFSLRREGDHCSSKAQLTLVGATTK